MSKILGSNPSTIKRTKKPGLTVHTYNNPITEEAEVGGLGYMARHYLKEMGKGRGGGRGVNIQEKKQMGRSAVQLAQCLPSMPKAPSQSQHHTNLHSGGGHRRIRSTRTFSVTQQGGDSLGYMRAPWREGGCKKS